MRRPLPRIRPQQTGFSLLELLIALVLVTIAGAVLLPRVNFPGIQEPLRRASRQLAATISQGRIRAMTEGRDYLLVLDLDAATFSLGPQTAVAGDRPRRRHTLPDGIAYLDLMDESLRPAAHGRRQLLLAAAGHATPALIHLSDHANSQTIAVGAFLVDSEITDGYLATWP